MSQRPAPFRQIDVTRALKAAKAAGIEVSRYEIDAEGRLAIFSEVGHIATTGKDSAVPVNTAYERWKAKKNGAVG